jgi:hypothetical protein
MRFRKLRIAWSAVCAITCALLIVLWVRSYWVVETVLCKFSHRALIGVESELGALGFGIAAEESIEPWIVFSQPSKKWLHDHAANRWPEQAWRGFYFSDVAIIAPYWFWSLVPAALAAAPWLKWSNRFSLHTLLIATTLVAVVLGTIGYLTRQ